MCSGHSSTCFTNIVVYNVNSNNNMVLSTRKTSVCLKIYTVFKVIPNGKGQVEAGREGYEMAENEADVFPPLLDFLLPPFHSLCLFPAFCSVSSVPRSTTPLRPLLLLALGADGEGLSLVKREWLESLSPSRPCISWPL